MLSNIKLEPRDTRPYYRGGLAGAQDPCWVIGASPATLIHEHTAKQNKNRFPLKFLFVVSPLNKRYNSGAVLVVFFTPYTPYIR